eukprot:TRINITY_DN5673_c0_g1_i10.p1 TRINITY_DN5673_c0_g1~~TRINITY_DN5673_c0_g1_i10.p1  ORF type:complete len:217 (+),score=36.60 TRINITY_DN5673_c0_g1_i10:124-774(+)
MCIRDRLHRGAFPRRPSLKDLEFQDKCLLLDWLTYDHMKIPKDFRNDEVLRYAASLLMRIDQFETTIEKLEVITEFYNAIVGSMALSSASGGAKGADDLLPVFTYVVIKAQPARLYSNINFIKGFRESKKLQGTAGYAFTNIQVVAYYIESLSSESLGMDDFEYEENVRESAFQNSVNLRWTHKRSAQVSYDDLARYKTQLVKDSQKSPQTNPPAL